MFFDNILIMGYTVKDEYHIVTFNMKEDGFEISQSNLLATVEYDTPGDFDFLKQNSHCYAYVSTG